MEVSDADAEDSTISTAGLGCSLYMQAVWKKAFVDRNGASVPGLLTASTGGAMERRVRDVLDTRSNDQKRASGERI